MRRKDIKIGMKVVPFKKTYRGYCTLSQSTIWNIAKGMGQPFLYVVDFETSDEDNAIVLDYNIGSIGGDFFNPSDFKLYNEED